MTESAIITLAHQLADVLKSSQLTMIEVMDGACKIRLARTMAAAEPMLHEDVPAVCGVDCEPDRVPDNNETLRAPIVGTVYLEPEANASPFVIKGQRVSIGDTLLFIEAMKVRNPIVAHRSGTIVDVLVANGWPVEYDQSLMVIG